MSSTPQTAAKKRAKQRVLHQVLRDDNALAAAVSRYATNELLAESLKLECDAEIKAISERFMAKLERLQGAMAEDFESIEDYARRHRSELFPGKDKTITINGHELAFRTGNPTVGTVKGTTQKAVLLALIEHPNEEWADRFVRWTESLNKDAILGQYDTETETWKPDGAGLQELGLIIDQAERFHLRPSRTLSQAQTTKGAAESPTAA